MSPAPTLPPPVSSTGEGKSASLLPFLRQTKCAPISNCQLHLIPFLDELCCYTLSRIATLCFCLYRCYFYVVHDICSHQEQDEQSLLHTPPARQFETQCNREIGCSLLFQINLILPSFLLRPRNGSVSRKESSFCTTANNNWPKHCSFLLFQRGLCSDTEGV